MAGLFRQTQQHQQYRFAQGERLHICHQPLCRTTPYWTIGWLTLSRAGSRILNLKGATFNPCRKLRAGCERSQGSLHSPYHDAKCIDPSAFTSGDSDIELYDCSILYYSILEHPGDISANGIHGIEIVFLLLLLFVVAFGALARKLAVPSRSCLSSADCC